MNALLAILILAAFGLILGGVLLLLSSQLGPKRHPSAAKDMPYECGVPGIDTGDTKVSVKYYLTAILFILFDIEIIFMYPWAITFREFISQGMGLYIFGAMFIFIALFVVGLVWEIKSKELDWN